MLVLFAYILNYSPCCVFCFLLFLCLLKSFCTYVRVYSMEEDPAFAFLGLVRVSLYTHPFTHFATSWYVRRSTKCEDEEEGRKTGRETK